MRGKSLINTNAHTHRLYFNFNYFNFKDDCGRWMMQDSVLVFFVIYALFVVVFLVPVLAKDSQISTNSEISPMEKEISD